MKITQITLSYYNSDGELRTLKFGPRAIDFKLTQNHTEMMYEDGVISKIINADMLSIIFFEYTLSDEYKHIIQDESNLWMCLRLDCEDDYDLTIWTSERKPNVLTTEFGDLELYWSQGGKGSC